jgi:hypothetical protein
MFERAARGNGSCHGHRDNDGMPNLEVVEQSHEIEHLIAQGISVEWQLASPVAAPVICRASIVSGQMLDLMLEHLYAVVLAVNEQYIRPVSIHLVVNFAAIHLCGRHVQLQCCYASTQSAAKPRMEQTLVLNAISRTTPARLQAKETIASAIGWAILLSTCE